MDAKLKLQVVENCFAAGTDFLILRNSVHSWRTVLFFSNRPLEKHVNEQCGGFIVGSKLASILTGKSIVGNCSCTKLVPRLWLFL